MKDIKKLLSRQACEILPDDDRVKDQVKRELGIEQRQEVLAYAHGGEQNVLQNRKRLFAWGAAALALVLCVCILIPVLLKRPIAPGPITDNKFSQITDADSFYAYSAASVGTILSAAQSERTGGAAIRTLSRTSREQASVAEPSHIDAVNRYLALVESLLSEGNIEGTGVSGDRGYAYGMSVNYTDLLGETVSYLMYYDKFFLSGETDGDEREENYSIRGVLLVGGEEYPVEGKYETESEDSESENELCFKAYTDRTKTSYIEVEQESEAEHEDGETETESEYVYSVYSAGRLVERTVIEYESENGELELKISITREGTTDSLVFRNGREGGERVLYASGQIGGQSLRFRVYVRQGQYHYVFEDGSSSDHDRFDDDDWDDDRDEEDD